ncbi:helix-turn-helix domain-containing protein [Paraburkholderia hospita]|uniref:helix-turn-helix domain-containing protein n=2 Tax=Paraburkholderia hospita TaxID=169430 RepID=UPI003F4FB311
MWLGLRRSRPGSARHKPDDVFGDMTPISAEEAVAAIVAANGNKSEAAKSLKISRRALYRILAKCDGRPPASAAPPAPPAPGEVEAQANRQTSNIALQSPV